MKPAYKFLLSAAAMLTAVACSNDFEDEANVPSYSGPVKTINVDAMSADNDSRTVIGEPNDGKYSVTWSATGECVALAEFYDDAETPITKGGLNCYESEEKYELNDPGSQARFRFQIRDDLEQTYNSFAYHALYPGSALVSFSATEAQFTLPAEQTAVLMENTTTKDGGDEDHPAAYEYKPDPNASVLVATVQQKDARADDGNNKLKLTFNHAAAYTRLRIYGLAGNTDVKSVKVTAADAVLAGNGTYTYPASNGAATISGDESGAKSVTVTADDLKTDDNGQLVVWMATLPAELTTSFTVEVTTGNNLVFTKTVDLEGQSKTVSLVAGNITKLAINMTEVESKGLFEGDYMIVAVKETAPIKYYALSSVINYTTSSGYRLQSSNESDEMPTTPEDLTYVWHIGMNEDKTAYYISNEYVEGENKYISWTSGNTAELSATAYELNISYDSDQETYNGYVNIASVNDPTRMLAKNNQAAIFAFYSGTQQYEKLYLVPVEAASVPVITLTKDDFEVAVEGVTNGSFDAKIENYATVDVTCEAEWVYDLSYNNDEHKIYYSVSANEDNLRETYIVITATGSTGLSAEKSVRIAQDGNDPYKGDFVIVAKDGDSYYALKAENLSNNKIQSKLYNGSLEKYSYGDDDKDIVWTIDEEDGYHYLANSGKYVGGPNANGNDATWGETKELLDFIAQEDGTVYMQSKTVSTKYLAYNPGNYKYFAFYTGVTRNLLLIPAEYDQYVPSYKPEKDAMEVAAEGEYGEIAVTSANVADGDVTDDVVYDGDSTGWLDIVAGAESIMYDADPNDTGAIRTATITVTAKNKNSEAVATATIKVTQKPLEAEHTPHVYTLTFKDHYDTANAYPTSFDYTNDSNAEDIKFTFSQGTNSNNAPQYYTTGGLRLYAGNTMTVSSDNTITKIVLAFGSGDNTNAITADSGTFNSPNWTGNTNSVTFTIGGSNSHRRIESVTVYCGEGGDTPTPSEPTIVSDGSYTVAAAGESGLLIATVSDAEDSAVQVSLNTNPNNMLSNPKCSNGKVTVDVSSNDTTSDREATVTVSVGSLTKSVTVKQAAASGGSQGGDETLVTDVLNNALTGVGTGTSYSDWNNKSDKSSAVYAGRSAGQYTSIQLNTTSSGVVTTKSGGTVKKIKVTWKTDTNNARTLNVYGKNTAYSSAADLYNSNSGDLIASFNKSDGDKEIEITGDYTYIGFRSSSNALYLDTVEITWSTGGGDSGSTTDPTDPDPKDPDQPEEASLVYTLETNTAGKNSDYGSNADMTISGITWNIEGNNTMTPWRLGGGKTAITNVDRALYSKTALSENITKLVITEGDANITVNSFKLIVAKDASFNTIVATKDLKHAANSEQTVESDGADWSNCYFKFVFNVTASGGNKYATISKVEFWGY